jgi:hypothetical protein
MGSDPNRPSLMLIREQRFIGAARGLNKLFNHLVGAQQDRVLSDTRVISLHLILPHTAFL